MLVDSGRNRDLLRIGFRGPDRRLLVEQNLVAGLEQHARGGVIRGRVEADLGAAVGDVQIHAGIQIGLLDAADFAEGIPVHAERLGLVGCSQL